MNGVVPLGARKGGARAPQRAPRGLPSTRLVALAIFASLVVVTSLAIWDELRESASALDDLGEEQARLANVLAASLATPATAETPALLATLRRAERPSALRVFLRRAPEAGGGLLTAEGAPIAAAPLETAFAQGASWAKLSRTDAAGLGLPARMALAGLARIDSASAAARSGAWGVAVVATAQRERDREARARWRLGLGLGLVATLILAFGGLALRTQRHDLELARELAVTAVQRAQDEQLGRADKLATMGALATGIAHEISTPLGVIVARAEQLLPRVAADERATRAVEIISEQTERISRIVRGFLSLARGDAPKPEHADVTTLAENALDLVAHRFERAGVALARDVDGASAKIACEPRLFEHVIVNLLLNGCDACAPGGVVTLTVRVDEERAHFIVTDTGEGISDEAAARATEPFFTTKPAGVGTGLGLAIASEIVKHHLGKLTIGANREGSNEGDGAARPMGTRASVDVPIVTRGHG